jgi:transcriptional regulator with XRE-family HTH domain
MAQMAVRKKPTGVDDPAMVKVRQLWAAKQREGWTQTELGKRMGYPDTSARQSVSQFLTVHDPKVGTLRRFAKALGISMTELFSEGKRS